MDFLTPAQNSPETENDRKVKFPKKIKRRGYVLATVYAKKKNYPFYRLAYRINGQRLMRHFRTYSEANREGKKLVKDLAKGSQVAALTAAQARDALAALERLQGFYVSTGRRVSLPRGISEYCEAASKLHGRTVGEAVDGYLGAVASVKRKDVAGAVEEFIRAEEPRAKASDNQRAQLSAKYAYNRAIMLCSERVSPIGETGAAHPSAVWICNKKIHHPSAFRCPFSSPIPSIKPPNRSPSCNEFHRCFDGKTDGEVDGGRWVGLGLGLGNPSRSSGSAWSSSAHCRFTLFSSKAHREEMCCGS